MMASKAWCMKELFKKKNRSGAKKKAIYDKNNTLVDRIYIIQRNIYYFFSLKCHTHTPNTNKGLSSLTIQQT